MSDVCLSRIIHYLATSEPGTNTCNRRCVLVESDNATVIFSSPAPRKEVEKGRAHLVLPCMSTRGWVGVAVHMIIKGLAASLVID